ncbi:MAG: rhodanese-like domain-containing protein [Bdellovibrionales bacterium]|nr:rhodanese-like domain-containing protein [Bdellovibrionales bacterium]
MRGPVSSSGRLFLCVVFAVSLVAAFRILQPTPVPVISVDELAALRRAGTNVFLLDVRQPEEHQRSAIPGSVLVPLGELEERFSEIVELAGRADTTVVYCEVGGRSERAVRRLDELGLHGAKNLIGGIRAYASSSGE